MRIAELYLLIGLAGCLIGNAHIERRCRAQMTARGYAEAFILWPAVIPVALFNGPVDCSALAARSP